LTYCSCCCFYSSGSSFLTCSVKGVSYPFSVSITAVYVLFYRSIWNVYLISNSSSFRLFKVAFFCMGMSLGGWSLTV